MDFPIQLKVDLHEDTVQMLANVADFKEVEVVIEDDSQLALAADQMQRIKGLAKNLDASRKEMTKPIDAAKKDIMDHFKAPISVLTTAENLIKKAMADYDTKKEKERIAAEAAAAEAERKRVEKLEERAEKHREKGNEEKADALEEEAAMAVETAVVDTSPKVEGVSYATTYSAEVKDLLKLVKAVAEGRIPPNAVMADTKFLNQQAKALKENFDFMYKDAGVKLKKEKTVRAKSK